MSAPSQQKNKTADIQKLNQTNSSEKHPLACYFVGVSLIIFLFLSVTTILIVHLDIIQFLTNAQFLRAHIICAGFGMLGASMAAMRKFYSTLISESTAKSENKKVVLNDWSFGWCYYYLTRPILGAVLGALAFLLSFIGFQVMASPSIIEISTEGRSLLYALAFLAGFSASNVLTRLDKIARKTFESQKDDNW